MAPSRDHDSASDPAEVLAARLLARYESLPGKASRPEYGFANEVWIGESVVVHIKRGVNGGLVREAAVAAILPAEVGYPHVVEQGVTGGLVWMINIRLPGENLKVAWPTLDASTRVAAVTDLWARLQAVHRTDVSAARAIGCTATPFYALDEADARHLLRWLLQNGTVRQSLHDQLGDMLDQLFAAMSDIPPALTHSDAGAHNTVWDGRKAIPVDFETASVAPPDLDLECVLRTLALQAGPNPAHALLEEAGDLLAQPRAKSRLLGYAVLRDLWETRSWLGDVRGGGRLQDPRADPDDPSTWRPVCQLQQHVARTSWMADLLR